jgi:hypothetical protein
VARVLATVLAPRVAVVAPVVTVHPPPVVK